jgi:hypothetical protein
VKVQTVKLKSVKTDQTIQKPTDKLADSNKLRQDENSTSNQTIRDLNKKLKQSNKLLKDKSDALNRLRQQVRGDRAPEGPLGRSSIEAYAGLLTAFLLALFPMNWWLRAIFFLAMIFLCSDFVWRSPFSFTRPPKFKLCLVLVVALPLIWVGWKNVRKQYDEDLFPPGTQYIGAWGPDDRQGVRFEQQPPPKPVKAIGVTSNTIRVNGNFLKRFIDGYKVIGVCFYWDGMEDYRDVPDVSISAPYDIKDDGEFDVHIPWNSHYIDEKAHGKGGTTYVLLLVPSKLSTLTFNTVREGVSKGAVILQQVGGTP